MCGWMAYHNIWNGVIYTQLGHSEALKLIEADNKLPQATDPTPHRH